jgi:hypothetical protein
VSVSADFALNFWRSLCDAFMCLQQSAPVVVKIYPPIYPLWGIAFSCVIGYSDFREKSLVSVTTFAFQIVDA